MDCNEVFMILTRGPFPTGEPWDEEVESHLERCGDCWRLAEALRPALEVFQEAVPPSESRDLPGYWGDARPSSQVVAELARGTARTALAAGARRTSYTSLGEPPRSTSALLGYGDLLRTAAWAATATAVALALLFFLRG